MDDNNLLSIVKGIHLLFWICMIIIVFMDFDEFNIFYALPIVYISYIILNDCLFELIEMRLGKNPQDAIMIANMTKSFNDMCFQRPLEGYGILVLAYIICLYKLRYKKTNSFF